MLCIQHFPRSLHTLSCNTFNHKELKLKPDNDTVVSNSLSPTNIKQHIALLSVTLCWSVWLGDHQADVKQDVCCRLVAQQKYYSAIMPNVNATSCAGKILTKQHSILCTLTYCNNTAITILYFTYRSNIHAMKCNISTLYQVCLITVHHLKIIKLVVHYIIKNILLNEREDCILCRKSFKCFTAINSRQVLVPVGHRNQQ